MLFAVFLLLAGMSLWFMYGPHGTGFLAGFAKLVDHPEFGGGLRNRLIGRSFLTGEFRGRKVVILAQRGSRSHPQMLVVSMATHAAMTMDSCDFAADRSDREAELALFALEAKHALRLRLQDGCLKALCEPFSLPFFVNRFDLPKWRSVLEAMHTLIGSLEGRALSGR